MQTGYRLPVFSATLPKASLEKTYDDALIALISAGDRRAFERLFARHNVRVFRYVARLTGNAALADDIVIEVFFAVWQTAHKFRSASQVSTWLLSIAHHKAASVIRRRSEAQIDDDEASAIVDGANDPEVIVSQKTRSKIIQKCLMQLPSAQREIIDLVYYQEKTIREVAQIVGIPEGTVKTRMYYARVRLAKLLKAEGISDAQPCISAGGFPLGSAASNSLSNNAFGE